MRYLLLLTLASCAETVSHPPTQADCGATVTVLRGDCACSLTVVYDADCRMSVVPVCPREADVHEMSVRRYPQSGTADLEVVWTDGTTCKSVLQTSE